MKEDDLYFKNGKMKKKYMMCESKEYLTEIKNVNGYKNIKVRVFYPIDTNLSSANTTVYMGGDGEMNFGGYFSTISANPSTLPSGGILILVAEGNNTSFDADSAIFATKFVQAFTNQKSGVKNSILGFSVSGILNLITLLSLLLIFLSNHGYHPSELVPSQQCTR